VVYNPRPSPTITTLEELMAYVDDELQFISQEFNGPFPVIPLQVVFREPDRPRDGMLVFADGTRFNPGSGRGVYEYRDGAWQKL